MIVRKGEPAPDFELPEFDSNGGPTKTVRLSRLLASGPAFVIFAKATCPTCVYALPLLDRVYRGYPESPASVVAVAQESAATAAPMRRELNLSMPILLDSEPYAAGEAFGLDYVPSGFLIGQDGVVEVAFESFDREAVEEINRRIAAFSGLSPAEIFPRGEGVPAFRPG